MFVAADKTTNFYKMDKETYKDLLEKHVRKDYKKTKTDEDSSKTWKLTKRCLPLQERKQVSRSKTTRKTTRTTQSVGSLTQPKRS